MVNDNIRRIDLGFVNAYLVKVEDGFILVDTGIAMQRSRLENELLQAGCLPDHLKLVIATHGDFDHTGNCAGLQRKYHVQIAMHEGDAEMVRTGVPARRHARSWLTTLMMGLGQLMGGSFDRFQPDILLEDGQSLAGFGLAAQVIHTPGHTRGSIAILTEDGQLIAGDTIDNRGRLGRTPFIENEQELEASLKTLKALSARKVYPGHGKPFAFEELASITS